MRGFTLIETIIYMAIVALVMGSLVSFGLSLARGKEKTFAEQELQANMRFAIDAISRAIRESDGVDKNNSVFDNEEGKLQLFKSESEKNPTAFWLDATNGVVRMREGSNAVLALTSNEVSVTALMFEDFAPGVVDQEAIAIQIEMQYGVEQHKTLKSARVLVTVRK